MVYLSALTATTTDTNTSALTTVVVHRCPEFEEEEEGFEKRGSSIAWLADPDRWKGRSCSFVVYLLFLIIIIHGDFILIRTERGGGSFGHSLLPIPRFARVETSFCLSFPLCARRSFHDWRDGLGLDVLSIVCCRTDLGGKII